MMNVTEETSESTESTEPTAEVQTDTVSEYNVQPATSDSSCSLGLGLGLCEHTV